jgi:IMP dehydrogenase
MGSNGAMARARHRYFQAEVRDTLARAGRHRGQVPYKGQSPGVLHQLAGGLKAAMGYVGARSRGFPQAGDFRASSTPACAKPHA